MRIRWYICSRLAQRGIALFGCVYYDYAFFFFFAINNLQTFTANLESNYWLIWILIFPSGEQHTYKCLSCPFSSMTISQLKEHSLRDHGEALTLPKLRAATQAPHATPRPSRLVGHTEQTSLAPDGNYVIFINRYKITWSACQARFVKSRLSIKAESVAIQKSVKQSFWRNEPLSSCLYNLYNMYIY